MVNHTQANEVSFSHCATSLSDPTRGFQLQQNMLQIRDLPTRDLPTRSLLTRNNGGCGAVHKPLEWVAHQVQTGFQVFILLSGLGQTVKPSSPTHTANRAKLLQTRKNHACLCGVPPKVPPALATPVPSGLLACMDTARGQRPYAGGTRASMPHERRGVPLYLGGRLGCAFAGWMPGRGRLGGRSSCS